MADVPGKFFKATKVRTGVSPSSPGVIEGETLPPLNPPGGSLNSVGLTMPSAFNVANSPLTSNGTLAVTGAGTVGQYIRGDGSLADFPQASGGGSSVSYYLNGSVDQGTIGGVAYRELSKVPILGAGTDFTINADGYIASFITDAGDPNLLEIPGGNWNFETYFSASSSGGTPTFYVELYKVSGTTATLIASSSSAPELIAFGTNLTPYYSTLAVPTTTLALTDRLAIRYYVTHSGRTITLHTENNHLCQVITTFTTGITALNGLTAQVQNFAVGTSGTDFNIASATATHTFNLPTASATNRGALSSADWSLFRQAYNDKINSASVTGTTTKTLTLVQQDGGEIQASWSDLNTDAVTSVFGRTGAVVAVSGDYNTSQVTESGNLYFTQARVSANTDVAANTAARHNAVTLGTANGLSLSTQQLSLGLASGSTTGALSSTDWNTFNNKQPAGNYVTTDTPQTISGEKTFTNSIILKNSSGLNGLVLSSFSPDRLQIGGVTYASQIIFPATSRTWNLPDATGTIALVGGSGVGTVTNVAALTLGTSGTDLSSTVANSTTTPVITLNVPTASATNRGALSAADWTTFNNKQNALTNPVTGTGVNGRVAFWNGTNSITSDADLLFNGSELNVSGIKIDGSFIPYIISTLAGSDLNIQFPVGQGLAINNNGAENIARISKNNITLYNGASTIQTSTGNLTITSGGGNGNIIITPNGSGTTTINSSVTASSFIRSGGTSSQYLMADGSVSTLSNPVTGTGTTNYLPKFTGSTTIGNSQIFDNGSGVGIGTASVTQLLTVNGEISAVTRFRINPSTQSNQIIGDGNAFSIGGSNNLGIRNDSGSIVFASGGATVQLQLNPSGNLGLGVTPSAWTAGGRNIEVGSAGNIIQAQLGQIAVIQNATFNAGWKYSNNGFASFNLQTSGQHQWFTAPSGTAGNAITFTQAMTLFSTGNLLVGSPSPISDNGARLQVSGTATFSSHLTVTSETTSSSLIQQWVYNGNPTAYRLRLNTLVSSGLVRYSFDTTNNFTEYPNNIVIDRGNVGVGTSPNTKFEVTSGNSASAEIQRWSYNDGNAAYSLRLKQDVSAGLVKHVFDVVNNSTTYANNLVLTNGNVGIGTNSPGYRLDTLFSNTTDADIFRAGMSGVSNGFTIQRVASNFRYTFLDGDVGIGATPTNGARLQVNGRAYINNVGGSVAGTTIYGNDQANVRLRLENVNGRTWELTGGLTGANNSDFTIYDVTASATRMVIAGSTGAATFSSSVTAASIASNNGGFRLKESSQTSSRNWIIGNDWLVFGDLAIGQSTTQTSLSYTYPIYINPSGNVGIGTTTDNGARLQVSGNITSTRLLLGTTTASSYRLSIVANSNFDTAGVLMQDTNTGGRVYTIGSSITTVGNFEIYDGNSAATRFSINSTGAATFSSSVTTGGTFTSSMGNNALIFNSSSATTGFQYITLINSGASMTLGIERSTGGALSNGSTAYASLLQTSNSTDLQFGTANNVRMTIASGGNVGIGTDSPNSRLQVSGSLSLPHTTKTANYTLDATDYTVGFDCASNRTATLPDATTCAGRVYVIYHYNTNNGARYVTIDPNGSQTINGLTTLSFQWLDDFSSVMIQSNGSNWVIISDAIYPSPV